MHKKFSGSGGLFGGSGPTETDDNLFSTDIVEAILGVSEGPINGLKDGPKTFLIGDTPLKNVTGENNFDSFELVVRKGSDLGEKIVSRMGGFASSTTVGTELGSAVPVVRQGTHTNIDYIDIRLVIGRLMRQTDDGTFNHTGKIKIEYKKTGSATWLPVTNTSVTPPPQEQLSAYTDVYSEMQPSQLVTASPGDRTVYLQNSAPGLVAGQESALWFDADDGYKPYALISSVWTQIPGSSLASSVWTWSEVSSWGTDHLTAQYRGASPPAIKEQGDYWVNTTENRVYFCNGSSWIVAGSSLAPGGFGGSGVTLSNGEVSITGKTTTNFVKEFRFPIDNISTDTYQLRITKTSPNNTSEDFFDVTWESFQEVTVTPLQFPGLASVQLTARASEQFSSIPQFSGIYEGRIVRVPVNYDPVARTYTGVWDGTWKLAYTNNPAFVVYDLVSNDRYGLNAYYPVVLNKWDVYEAGQWCDTRTVDGIPRFTFNQLIDTARSCREAIDYICGIFGGRFFDDGNGSANIRIDKPENASGIFMPENVVDGIFSYSFTEITNRYNDITVTFKNPDLNYKEDRRRVYDQDHIDKYGRIPLNFIAVGCNSSAEAIVRGRYKLVTGLAERAIVNFKTNRQGMYYVPYDIILVVDNDMESGISGRVKDIVSTKTFTLRDPIYLEPGFNYKVIFQLPDGTDTQNFILLERALTTGISGTFTSITTLVDLPTGIPDQAVFSISTTDDHSAPKAYRITRIDEMDGDPDKVEIQAIEVNRVKWDFVDGIITDLEEPDHHDLGTGGRTAPVPAVRLRAFNGLNGSTTTHNLLMDWDPSPTPTVDSYKVFMSKDNGPQSLVATAKILSWEFNDITPGEYLFSVVAVSSVNSSLADSLPRTIEHRFVGDYKDPTRVNDLHMVDEASPPIYARRSPTFAWTAVSNPNHRTYVIRIYDSSSGVVMGEHTTVENQYTYDYETNRADHSMTAARNFNIGVASRDQFDGLSAFNIISATNPTPAAVVPTIVPGIRIATISWNTTGIVDYLGAKVWISTTNGFTPGILDLEYDGGGNSFVFTGFTDTVYYIRIALYDDFDQTNLTMSSQYTFSVDAVDIGDVDESLTAPIGYITDVTGTGLAERLNAIETSLERLAAMTTDNGATQWTRSGQLERSVKVQGAEFQEMILVASNDIDAIATQVSTLSTDLGSAVTLISNETTARSSADTAIALTVTNLGASFDNNTASGSVGFKVAANAGGSTARWQMFVSTDNGVTKYDAGMFAEVFSGGGSRVGIKADQFVIWNSGSTTAYSPFYITGGTVYMDNAFITGLTASHLNVTSLDAITATLGNVVVTGSLIVNNTLTTIKTGSGEMTGKVTARQSGSCGVNTTIVSASATITYGVVTVTFTGVQDLPSPSGTNFGGYLLRILCDGSVIKQYLYGYDDNWAQPMVGQVNHNPGVGSHTYTVDTSLQSGSGAFNISGGELTIENDKR